MLIEQSDHQAFGPVLQGPGLDAHGQGTVQFKAPPGPVADDAQILGGRMMAVIQEGGVLDEQIVAGLAAGLAGALQMGCQHRLEGDAALAKEAVGSLELGPVGAGLGQRAAGRGGQAGGDFQQALLAARVTQLGEGEFGLGPLARRQKRGAHRPGPVRNQPEPAAATSAP